MVVAATTLPGSTGAPVSGPAAAKRYIRALVQTGHPAADSGGYDEMEVVGQTAALGASELGRLLGAIAEELQTELTSRVNEEFEGFVGLFNDIGAMGEEEFVVLADKVALIRGLVHVPDRVWPAALCSHPHPTLQEAQLTGQRDLDMLEDVLGRYRANVAEQKRVRLAQCFQGDLDRLASLLDGHSLDDDGVILQLATEFFLKARRLVIAASGRVELPGVLLDRFAQLSASLHGRLDDALLRVLRANEAGPFQEIALVMIRIGKGATLMEAFASDLWRARLHSVRQTEGSESQLTRVSNPCTRLCCRS